MLPFVLRIRVAIILINTDLPLPEPPSITRDSPLFTSRLTPFRTFLRPKFFVRFLTTIFLVTKFNLVIELIIALLLLLQLLCYR